MKSVAAPHVIGGQGRARKSVGSEVLVVPDTDKSVGSEVAVVLDSIKSVGSVVSIVPDTDKLVGSEVPVAPDVGKSVKPLSGGCAEATNARPALAGVAPPSCCCVPSSLGAALLKIVYTMVFAPPCSSAGAERTAVVGTSSLQRINMSRVLQCTTLQLSFASASSWCGSSG